MKTKTLLLALLFLPILFAGPACASWIIYHKPAFEGQILDGDTKEPIEGAVVVVRYQKEVFAWPAGPLSRTVAIRETLTDKEGRFHFPSYTTLIQPFSWEGTANFIIYKPGYISEDGMFNRNLENLFSGQILDPEVLEFSWRYNRKEMVIRYAPPNFVYLPKAKTRKDRLDAIPSPFGPMEFWPKHKILKKVTTEEREFLHSYFQ